MTDRPIRVRMAPSPTGHLHVGTAKAALFNWMFARRYGGTFVLRLEDTDAERSRDEFARELVTGLSWLGIDYDEGPYLAPDGAWAEKGAYGPYKQSERSLLYREKLQQLLDAGSAYWCYCTKEELEVERRRQQEAGEPLRYAGTCRDLATPPAGRDPQVIRLRVPAKPVAFTDLVRGQIVTDASLLGDLAIARSLDSALYNFAVVVDDIAMEITHVVRGEDHISNTPKQLLLFEAFGAVPPAYAHFPLNLDADRRKLSKRTSETSLLAYRDAGYLPAALTNFLALSGWHPAGDEEVFTLPELAQAFSTERMQRSGAVFDEAKLRWLNREHMKRLPAETLAKRLRPFLADGDAVPADVLERYVDAERGRADTLAELAAAAAWLGPYAPPSAEALIPADSSRAESHDHLRETATALEHLASETEWLEQMQAFLEARAERHGKRAVFHPVRVALSAMERSPDPVTLMRVLGQDESRARLQKAAEILA